MSAPRLIADVAAGGWAGWRWVTFKDGLPRSSVTLREIQARTRTGEWTLTDAALRALRESVPS